MRRRECDRGADRQLRISIGHGASRNHQNDGVAADQDSVNTALKTWTGCKTSAARKLRLFEDRLVDLALELLPSQMQATASLPEMVA
jgi:hypothetical protein